MRLARRIAEKGVSVRQVEEEVRRRADGATSAKRTPASKLPVEILDQIRESFFSVLGVMPKVRDRGAGGVIELPFKDSEELARLLERLS